MELSQSYPESEGLRHALHTFMIAAGAAGIHYLDGIEALKFMLAMYEPLKQRGGVPDWRAEPLAERNAVYRERARAEYGTEYLTPAQADDLVEKVKREVAAAHVAEGSGDIPSDAIRRIRAAGIIESGRHLRRVLPEKKLGQPI